MGDEFEVDFAVFEIDFGNLDFHFVHQREAVAAAFAGQGEGVAVVVVVVVGQG